MNFANQVMFGLRELLDTLGHVVEFFQHRVLTGRNPVHPPKADEPTANADPSESDHDHPRSYIASRSSFSNREATDGLRRGKRCKMKMSILWRANRVNIDVNGDLLANSGNRFRSCSKHQTKVAPFQRLSCNLPVRLLEVASGWT